jgi:Rrf2 family protein
MKISAKSDYAVRAVAHLASAHGARVTAETLAVDADIPRQFLENILGELRRARIVRAHRGTDGGYELARPPAAVTLGSVLRAVGSPLAVEEDVPAPLRGRHDVESVWLALRSTTRTLLDRVTFDDVVNGTLPPDVSRLAALERERGASVDAADVSR